MKRKQEIFQRSAKFSKSMKHYFSLVADIISKSGDLDTLNDLNLSISLFVCSAHEFFQPFFLSYPDRKLDALSPNLFRCQRL